jgi:phage tail sheath protein FI
MPPSGHIAGIWARNDITRGVHKAPANEIVRGAVGLAYNMTKGEQDVLNPEGVNCIRSFPGMGIRVWGARTLSSNPSWRYLNVRRLFNYAEKSIERGTQWVVFEPNDHRLWGKVRRDVTAFLLTMWRDGMLFGLSPEEAFFVRCDETTNPRESRDLGRLIVEIGMAPVKPAEFVIFRISQWAGPGAEE